MAHLVVYVLDRIEQCGDILDVWDQAGAPAITILESTGLQRLRRAARDDLPLLTSLRSLLASQESHHRTLFTVIEDEETMQRVVDATKACVGDFNRPHAGLLFVVPVSQVYGLEKDNG
jgi:nitrogen regulatory protein PII